MLTELIEGGFVGQAIIATLVWGGIVIALVRGNPVDDRLYDAGYVVLGYFFHMATVAVSTRNAAEVRRVALQTARDLKAQHALDIGDDC